MDLAIAATYYRTALLLGLLPGEDVHRWAESVIACEVEPAHQILELALVPSADLSGLRHGLWPLSIEPEPKAVLEAMLALLHADLEAGRRTLRDTLTVLRQMRSMLRLPSGLYEDLNRVLVDHETIGVAASPIPDWLRQFAAAGMNPLRA